MAVLIYDIIVRTYFLAIELAAFFNPKAKLWAHGRRGIFENIEKYISQKRRPGQKLVWVHCASLGEFEQGRPVIGKIKNECPGVFILLTFFSPSGFEIRKDYPKADCVTYLPADSRKNARLFLDIVQPDLAIFVKYEFWHHFLQNLRQRKIPTYLIAATFRKGQFFFNKTGGGFHRDMLSCFTKILVQDRPSAKLLADIGFTKYIVCGDPRVDRVLEISAKKKGLPYVEKFCGKSPVLVCGSTWGPDEKCISPLICDPVFSGWKLIIAPHDISEKRLAEIENIFPKNTVARYSHIMGNKVDENKRILLIDNIGLLSSLYYFAKTAYVGGGFGAGIHNILEPLAFGVPVVFGPRFQKFHEAESAIKTGCGFEVGGAESLMDTFRSLSKPARLVEARKAAQELMAHNKGATGCIFQEISLHLC